MKLRTIINTSVVATTQSKTEALIENKTCIQVFYWPSNDAN